MEWTEYFKIAVTVGYRLFPFQTGCGKGKQ